MNKVAKCLKTYLTDWRYVSAGFCLPFALFFLDEQLAIGPGWDKIWILAYLGYGLFFLILCFFVSGLFKYFVCCGVLTIGGCYTFNKATSLPEETEIELGEYNRIALGKYSEWIPVGAHDIKFSYDIGLFSHAKVRCKVSEGDFKWFCWRNGKRLRSDCANFNERTQEIAESSSFFPEDITGPRFYAHVCQYRNAGGWFIYYNRDTQDMYLMFSTN